MKARGGSRGGAPGARAPPLEKPLNLFWYIRVRRVMAKSDVGEAYIRVENKRVRKTNKMVVPIRLQDSGEYLTSFWRIVSSVGEFFLVFGEFFLVLASFWRVFANFWRNLASLATFGRLLANFGECSSFCGDFDEFYAIF